MAITLISGVGASNSAASGNSGQSHLTYAPHEGKWLCFSFVGTNQLAAYYSANFASFTQATGSPLTLAQAHGSEGRTLAVSCRTISDVDVIHISIGYKVSSTDHRVYHIRATFSGTTISFGTETQVGVTFTTNDGYSLSDQACCIGSTGRVFVASGFGKDTSGYYAAGGLAISASADAFDFPDLGTDQYFHNLLTASGYIQTMTILPIASGNTIAIVPNAASDNTFANLKWAKSIIATSSWNTAGDVLTTPVSGVNQADYCACRVSDTDIHVVIRSGSNTYVHRRFDGSAWSDNPTGIPTQASVSGRGVFMVSDGTDAWLFVITSTSQVMYNKWTASGTAWDAAWTELVGTSVSARTFITGYQGVGGTKVGVIWTQVNGANYDVNGETLTVSAPPAARGLFRNSTLAGLGAGGSYFEDPLIGG